MNDSKVNGLAFERARAVQDYIIKFGVPVERLVVGTQLPVCRECKDIAQVQKENTVIFNLATQPDPGPTATLGQISFAVGGALEACASWNIPALGIPRIGAGLGGLQWADVRKTLQETASQQDAVELVVVSLPEKTWPS